MFIFRKTPIDIIENHIKKNWKKPDASNDITGLSVKVWYVDKYVIRHMRQVRGDLIEVFIRKQTVQYEYILQKSGEPIFGYVDQSYQYGGLLGINDVIDNGLDFEDFKKCFTII